MTASFETEPFSALLMGDESLTIACWRAVIGSPP